MNRSKTILILSIITLSMLSMLSIDSSESWYSDTESVDTTISSLSVNIRSDGPGIVSLENKKWTLSSGESPSNYSIDTTTDIYMVVNETNQSTIDVNGRPITVSTGTVLHLHEDDQITSSGMIILILSTSTPTTP